MVFFIFHQIISYIFSATLQYPTYPLRGSAELTPGVQMSSAQKHPKQLLRLEVPNFFLSEDLELNVASQGKSK